MEKLTFQQEEILGKFCSKTGKASHAYEGIVKRNLLWLWFEESSQILVWLPNG